MNTDLKEEYVVWLWDGLNCLIWGYIGRLLWTWRRTFGLCKSGQFLDQPSNWELL